MRRTVRRKGGRKTRKGGFNIGPLVGVMKGCPKGKVRAFGGQCGMFRTSSGCCIDNTATKLTKEKSVHVDALMALQINTPNKGFPRP